MNTTFREALISEDQQMTSKPETENIRTTVSTHLSKILMLMGRLNPDYNSRYLPVTVTAVLYLVSELEQIEKNHGDFATILGENIERREKHLHVFDVPDTVKRNPTSKGIRLALYELADPLIKNYCEEEKMFLSSGLGPQVSRLVRLSMLMRTEKNCSLLSTLCKGNNCDRLQDLKQWCEAELASLK
jgi:hypothetical protein